MAGGIWGSAGGGGGGDASASNQVTGNASLASIDGKTFSDSVSTGNSSAVALGSSGVFTGSAIDTLGITSLSIGVFANQASATDGLSIQQSSDGTNWDSADAYTVPASTGKVFVVNPTLRYVRVVYTNGASAQATFRLQTILRVNPFTRGSVQRPQDARTNDNDFDESITYPGFFNGTTWDRMRGDITNGLDVDVTRLAGQTAHSSASTGAPVRIGGRVKTAVDTTLVAGDACDVASTTDGAIVAKAFSVPEQDWTYAAPTGGITNSTTAVTVKAAAAAGVRNYVTGLQLSSDALGAATEFAIRDGAAGTVLYRQKIGTAGIINGLNIQFATPLRGSAATLLEIVTLTGSVTGGVFCNLQGYTAP